MRWFSKALVIFAILLLVGGIAFFGYLVHARIQGNEYQFQIDAMLAAAAVANQEQPLTEPDRAVIAAYEGKSFAVHPENYKMLSFYLRKDCAMPPWGNVNPENALEIVFCEEGRILAAPMNETGDQVLIQLETRGKKFTMHIRGGNVWSDLVRCCIQGTYKADNIPLN